MLCSDKVHAGLDQSSGRCCSSSLLPSSSSQPPPPPPPPARLFQQRAWLRLTCGGLGQVDALRQQLQQAKEEGDKLTSENAALHRQVTRDLSPWKMDSMVTRRVGVGFGTQVKAMEEELSELRKAHEALKTKLKAAEDDIMTLKTQASSRPARFQ